jgi:hypothetical protein
MENSKYIIQMETFYQKLVSIHSKTKQDISINKNNEFKELKLKITQKLTEQAELGINTLLYPGINIEFEKNRKFL